MIWGLSEPTLISLTLLIIEISSIITILFFERRDPATTLTWLLLIMFLPLIGLTLYFFFGRGLKLGTKKSLENKLMTDKQLHENLRKNDLRFERDLQLIESGKLQLKDPSLLKYLPLVKLHYRIGKSRYTDNNKITIFTDGSSKYEALLADIEQAGSSINMVYFIFKADKIGQKIIAALTQKAQQGVQVRIVFDSMGSWLTKDKAFRELKAAGGQVFRFFPLRLPTLFRANYRNHRKIVVIDGRIAYTGGMNIGDEYMGLNSKLAPWRDTHIRLTGNSVRSLQARFLMDWYYASDEEQLQDIKDIKFFFPPMRYTDEEKGDMGMQIVSSGPDVNTEQIKRGIIKMVHSATRSVLIQTPYFIPDRLFLEAMQVAAASGVSVKLMIPRVPDHKYVQYAGTSYIQDLLDFDIEVTLYPGFLHAKMVVVDDEIATIGTCNMDIRSFSLHFEVNGFIYDRNFARQCSDIFYRDRNISQIIDQETYNHRSRYIRVAESICRLASPLM